MLLSDNLHLFEEITTSNDQSLIYLQQLASSSIHSKFLLSKIPDIYNICMSNHCLNCALTRLLANSIFDCKTGKFQINQAKCKEDQKLFKKLFEYLYFASDEFLSEVL
jgi:dihydroflavonol-4-reductase